MFELNNVFRMVNEQLRREKVIQRMPVSQAISDLVKYITENEEKDFLLPSVLSGFPKQNSNLLCIFPWM